MVNNIISLDSLNMEELSGVVNIYPWFAGARMELCQRMAALGEDGWTEQRFAQEAIYLVSREKLYRLLHPAKPVEKIQAPQIVPGLSGSGRVIAVGGDYFSQEDYDSAKQEGDDFFRTIRNSMAPQEETPAVSISPVNELEFDFCTESLARAYEQQGYTDSAKHIYEQLSLRFPEKSVYFATLINNLGKE